MKKIKQGTLEFEAWKKRLRYLTTSQAKFEKWLFIHIAGVLFERKTGELLSLPAEQFALQFDKRMEYIATLSEMWGVFYQTLYQTPVSTKIIIFNCNKVRERLAQVGPYILFSKLKYSDCLEPTVFLDELARRWREKGAIPHEIGLALGYPVKDVLGYMGLSSLECTGCCGWQIYGDTTLSLQKSREFMDARQNAICFLHHN
jgi:hypothetical protein